MTIVQPENDWHMPCSKILQDLYLSPSNRGITLLRRNDSHIKSDRWPCEHLCPSPNSVLNADKLRARRHGMTVFSFWLNSVYSIFCSWSNSCVSHVCQLFHLSKDNYAIVSALKEYNVALKLGWKQQLSLHCLLNGMVFISAAQRLCKNEAAVSIMQHRSSVRILKCAL